jgi:hypothetical protein
MRLQERDQISNRNARALVDYVSGERAIVDVIGQIFPAHIERGCRAVETERNRKQWFLPTPSHGGLREVATRARMRASFKIRGTF